MDGRDNCRFEIRAGFVLDVRGFLEVTVIKDGSGEDDWPGRYNTAASARAASPFPGVALTGIDGNVFRQLCSGCFWQ